MLREQAALARKGNIHITESEEMIYFEFEAFLNNLQKELKEEAEAQAKALKLKS